MKRYEVHRTHPDDRFDVMSMHRFRLPALWQVIEWNRVLINTNNVALSLHIQPPDRSYLIWDNRTRRYVR